MKKTKTDSKERKVKDSIQSICVNEQLRYQRIHRRLVSELKGVMQFFEKRSVSVLPTDLDDSADITFNTITCRIIVTCDVWIKILTDEKEVVFIRQTKTYTINEIFIATVSCTNTKRANKIFYFWFMHNMSSSF